MELRHLRYFKVAAEELNISRAAARLHIAQPPLSRQIKELEAELGVKLFERLPRGLALTTAGEAFEGYCTQLLERLSFSIEATQRLARKGKRRFGIGFVPSSFYGQLPTLVRRLRQIDALEIVLQEMTSVQQVAALHSGQIDIGFGRIWLDGPGVRQEVLFEEPVLAALPARHPLVGTRPSIERLAEEPLIVYPARPRPSYADVVLGMFHQRGLHIEVLQETNELQTAIGLVACEMGITLVPRTVRRLVREDVVYEGISTAGLSSPLIMCLRHEEKHDPLMASVLEHVYALIELRKRGKF
ncbi:LysR family transcriptional regulator [Halotalea alkalilenta]|uniref:LysR family transcriptional regulator n=1 Tax=Halotalea alkalilenta TaxID=376489 RepID=UPI0004851E19|nr:LysR family transcriptional regulator [Halotalea alkalilenta]